jgi:hypothetical protein
MKKILQSRFVSEYGSIFVLLALCAYYSIVTLAPQHPISEPAGRSLAREIVEQHRKGPRC